MKGSVKSKAVELQGQTLKIDQRKTGSPTTRHKTILQSRSVSKSQRKNYIYNRYLVSSIFRFYFTASPKKMP